MATEVEKLIVRLEVSQNRFDQQMRASAAAAAKAAGAIETRFAKMNKNLTSQFSSVGKAVSVGLALAAGSQTLGALAEYSARFRDIQNALKVTGLEGKNLSDVFEKLSDISSAQGTPLDALVTLYSRTSMAAKQLNASQADLIQFSEGVALSLRVGSTSAEKASGALLQLSQALGGGTVQAEEYNSLIDGASPLLQAVAAGMKQAGGSVATLTALVKAGKVSSEAFFRAGLAGFPVLAAQADKTEGTISTAYGKIDTAMLKLIGHLDKTSGVSRNAADNLSSVATAILALPGYIDTAVTKLGDLRTKLSELGSADIFVQLRDFLGVDGEKATADFLKARGEQISVGGLVLRPGTVPEAPASGNRRATASVGAGASGKSAPIRYTPPIKPIDLDDYRVGGKGKGNGKAKKDRDDSYEREVKQIQERTSALTAETAAQAGVNPLIDDYGYAVSVASVKQDLLTAAQEAGVKITPEVTANIQKLAEGYATASVASDKLRESQEASRQSAQDVADLGKDALSGFVSDLRNGVTATEALGNALDKIADKLIDNAFDMLFDTTGKAGGGILGGIGKLFGFANGGIAAHGKPLPTFASGGVSKSASIFGEAGPEAAVPLPDGRRIPVDLKMPAKGSAAGSGGQVFNIDARGAQKGVGEEIRAAFREHAKGDRARTVAAYNDARRRGMIR